MKGFLSVFKRELRGYFSTPLAYVFLVIFLFFSSFLAFQQGFFEIRQASLRVFFMNMPLMFILLVPAIAMRLWAEERRTNSIELLFTLPLTITQAVLGKFFAAWTVMALALLLTCPMVITVAYLGDPDWGPIITGYLGSLLMAGSYLAIGSFFSCLTRNQVIAFVLSLIVSLVFVLSGYGIVLDFFSSWAPVALVEAISSFSFLTHFDAISKGVIDMRDMLYFASVIMIWLFANAMVVNARKAD